ncbi:zinc-ribbon domain-containing protein [Companilactobacillus jidongensis]|uniref:zinc-ribbon domain-containing protein n=1 Tax=Companilactobacillus jidongensis TaxID=2486006 RepID=UPI0013DE5608|nr:zinc-ribbon domain-containing protein [Companilactobacillus jidongensis]
MFCPNCGHKVDLSQKFCDNCGYDLTSIKSKRNDEEKETPKKDDDTIKSLADIEAELNDSEPVKSEPTPVAKPKYEQAPAQQREYSSVKPAAEFEHKSEPVSKPATPSYDSVRTFDSTKKVPDEALDDRTVAYNKDAFKQATTQKPYSDSRTSNPTHSEQQQHESAALNTTQDFKNKLFKNGEDPFKPTKSEMKKIKERKKQEQAENDTNDGLIHNMGKFAKNNAYLGIFAVIIVAILLVVKRNYGFIALAIVLLLWFLASQVSHGNEMNANKKFKRDNRDKNQETNNQPQQYQEEHRKPKKQKVTDASRGKNTRQKVIIGSSIVGFAASVGGPFINGVSLSSTIASAANYTANFGYQYSTLIVNLSSAIRLICFLSPVIALIAACFRNKGTIRMVRIFTVLPTVIYALVFGIFYSGAVNSAVITGQTAVGGTQFGASFYILLVTSIVSLIMAYSLHPRVRI